MVGRNRIVETMARMPSIALIAAMLALMPHVCLAGNLLAQPGFEFPAFSNSGVGPWSTSSNGWLFEALQAGQDQGAASETVNAWSPPVMTHGGADAMRVYGTGGSGPYHVAISQVVPVSPSAEYEASAWVVTRSYGAGGFGQNASDWAGVIAQELDCAGQVILEHKSGFSDPSDLWRQASVSFTTTCYTQAIKFVLDGSFYCQGGISGHVVYDDCILDGPQPETATVRGIVTSTGGPTVGANVTLEARSTVTGEGGAYSFENVPVTGTRAQVTATKAGHYPAAKTLVLQAGENIVDLDLVELPASNLLVNGGFEFEESQQGPAPWSVASHGWLFGASQTGQSVGAASETLNAWGLPAMIHGESQAMRVFANSGTGPYSLSVSQVVSVGPNVDCTASAWIAARSYGPSGFGDTATDFAGIVIEELNAAGGVVKTHGRVGVRTPSFDWRYVAEKFRTLATTASVRYSLKSMFSCVGDVSGHIVYDDCALEAPVGVSRIRELPDESKVYIGGQPVTYASDGFFYVESPDRTCGIRVTGTAAVGSSVIVRGVVRTVDGERTVVADSVMPHGTAQVPRPLGMGNPALGASTATGLYAKMWGRVVSTGAGSFVMTDGGAMSLKVYGSAALNDYVVVTGVLGAEMAGDLVIPILRSKDVTKID